MQLKNRPMLTMIMALAFGVMGMFAADVYAPSLPAIHRALQTTAAMAQMTVTVYFLGLGITPLLFGPLSDAVGRRKILIIALILAMGGSFVCVIAHTIYGILAGRMLQGIGLGIAASLSRTIARDLFEGRRLAEVASMLSLLMGLAPIIAPLLGSYLQHWFGWRSAFYFILTYLIIIGACIAFLFPETLTQRTPFHFRHIGQNYLTLFKGAAFMSNAIAAATATGVIIAFFITAPFLLQKLLNVSVVTYGWIITCATAMSLCSRFVNLFLVRKFDSNQIVFLGLSIMFIGSLTLFLVAITGEISTVTIVISAMMLVFGTGLIYSNAIVGALMPYRHIGGTAGALFGSLQMLGGFAASIITSRLDYHNVVGFSLELLLITVFAILLRKSVSYKLIEET